MIYKNICLQETKIREFHVVKTKCVYLFIKVMYLFSRLIVNFNTCKSGSVFVTAYPCRQIAREIDRDFLVHTLVSVNCVSCGFKAEM